MSSSKNSAEGNINKEGIFFKILVFDLKTEWQIYKVLNTFTFLIIPLF